jgi:L-ascorbate metabolism protein UlaG (beta-lactamase superfamily)
LEELARACQRVFGGGTTERQTPDDDREMTEQEKRVLRVTYIGGPTALLEFHGLRILTDPTFDPAGTTYPTSLYTLRKTAGPSVPSGQIGRLDAVLLSHDHHFDNLDHAGRDMLARAKSVLTTPAGASRLGGAAAGLSPWQSTELATAGSGAVVVTGTPARHGPPGADRGPVTGFVLSPRDHPEQSIYVSGDTVWYEGVAEVARRFPIRVALLFMGAARVREVGPHHLTFTAREGVEAARAFSDAAIVPLHFEGWAHFSESRSEIEAAFAEACLEHRLRLPAPGGAEFAI